VAALDFQELHVEDEGACGGPGALGFIAIGEVRGDPEAELIALFHELDALGPALDDAVEGEAGGLAAGDAGVEHLAVRGPA
jgi:hypothetical protein